MGTLLNQPPRESFAVSAERLEHFLAESVTLAKKHHIPVADVVAAKHALELERRNNLAVRTGTAFDEQMAGFASRLDELVATIRECSD